MRVAVTGAAGHLGGNVVRALLAAGDEVRVLLRSDDRAVHALPVERVVGDLFDVSALARLVEGCEVVVHAAALVSISGGQKGEVARVNVEGTRRVAEASLAARVRRLVHVSSVHALDLQGAGETLDDLRPWASAAGTPAYDLSKAAAEREVVAAGELGIETIRLRPTAIVGPYDFKPSRTGRFLQALLDREVPALVSGGFDWVDVRDVARVAVAACRQGESGAAYLVGGHWRTIAAFAGEVANASGTAAPPLALPVWLTRLGLPFAAALARLAGTEPLFTRESLRAIAESRQIDCSRAKREFAYSPRLFEETIRDTVHWFSRRSAPAAGAEAA